MIHSTAFPHCSSRRARAAAHRAMAVLASNSCLRVRYRRYHFHMCMAEALSRGPGAIAQEAMLEVSE